MNDITVDRKWQNLFASKNISHRIPCPSDMDTSVGDAIFLPVSMLSEIAMLLLILGALTFPYYFFALLRRYATITAAPAAAATRIHSTGAAVSPVFTDVPVCVFPSASGFCVSGLSVVSDCPG